MMQEKDKRLLISGAQIIDGTGSKPFLGNIIVLGDRIESVTKGSKLSRKIENLKNTIDAKNLTVMPGLIDAHCHITFDEPCSNDELFFIEEKVCQLLLLVKMHLRYCNLELLVFLMPIAFLMWE